MRAVAACLLHRLEIVGGVPLLCLRVAAIDVIGVRHVLWPSYHKPTRNQESGVRNQGVGSQVTGITEQEAGARSQEPGWSGIEESVGASSGRQPAGLHSHHSDQRSRRA